MGEFQGGDNFFEFWVLGVLVELHVGERNLEVCRREAMVIAFQFYVVRKQFLIELHHV